MLIDFRQLSLEALQGVLESIVLREGTDYGEYELSLAAKIERLRDSLERGDTALVFDSATESLNVLPADQIDSLGS